MQRNALVNSIRTIGFRILCALLLASEQTKLLNIGEREKNQRPKAKNKVWWLLRRVFVIKVLDLMCRDMKTENTLVYRAYSKNDYNNNNLVQPI